MPAGMVARVLELTVALSRRDQEADDRWRHLAFVSQSDRCADSSSSIVLASGRH